MNKQLELYTNEEYCSVPEFIVINDYDKFIEQVKVYQKELAGTPFSEGIVDNLPDYEMLNYEGEVWDEDTSDLTLAYGGLKVTDTYWQLVWHSKYSTSEVWCQEAMV